MLRWLLLIFKWIWPGQKRIRAQRFIQSKSSRIERISELPDDLLVNILVHLPAKVAVSTLILSKRWRSFWRMQPELIMHLKTQAELQNLKSKLPLRVETRVEICPQSNLDWLEPNCCYDQISDVYLFYLYICLLQVVCCNTLDFSHLRACKICPPPNLDWLEPFMCFLQNSPMLKVVLIFDKTNEDFPLSFNPPSYVPTCLSTHLEIFEWQGYGGRPEQREVLRYIFANSKSLKRVDISLKFLPTLGNRKNRKNKKKIAKELETMYNTASVSPGLIFSTQAKLIVL
ncbi:hypothetical protein N665_0106s0043 [Sinapis alba]|nr:hypothetical protein N665_0106s0043 [Sinapis alba]